MNLEGKVALVTGAAKRIGRTIALNLAEQGCDVAVHYHTSGAEADETAKAILSGGRRAVTLAADLSDPVATARLPERTAESLGRLDILINNASVFEPMDLDGFNVERWSRTLAINLTAPMVLAHAAFPRLKANGQGRIVNLLDISAERPWSGHLAYCVSKAGLATLTTSLAKAMAPDVRVNGVAPGAVLFPDHYDAAKIKAITRRIPTLRAGSAEDVAAAVRFLVCGCDYITGAVLNVDGGRSIAW